MFVKLIPLQKIADKFKWCYNSVVPKGTKTSVKTRKECCNYGFSCTRLLFSTDSRNVETLVLVIPLNDDVEEWI